MATKVKNNLGAVRTLNTLGKNSRAAQKNLRKVATGERITSVADDASGYGISERMREQIRSLDQANQNTQNDMAMMRTAEGAVANIVEALKTLKQKAIDSANDSNTDDDRRIMQKEVDQLLDQIDDNALVTFNGKFLVNGKMASNVETRTVLVCEGVSGEYSGGSASYSAARDAFYKPMTELMYAYDTNHIKAVDYTKISTRLGIEETDIMKISHVLNGKTYTRIQTIGTHSLGEFLMGFEVYDAQGYHYGENIRDIPELMSFTFSNSTDYYPEIKGLFSTGEDLYAGSTHFGNGYNGFLADSTNKPIRVQNPNHNAIALVSGNDYTKELYDSYHRYRPIRHALSSVSITVMDENGQIKQDATRALQFKCVQLGQHGNTDTGGRIKWCNLPRRRGRESINIRRLAGHALFSTRTQKHKRHEPNQHFDTRRRTCRH